MKNLHFVIVYDIADTKRRNQMAQELEGVGRRVNLSVFECEFKPEILEALLEKTARIINRRRDSVIFYPQCLNCLTGVTTQGRKITRLFSSAMLAV